jgi:hypothetical protein
MLQLSGVAASLVLVACGPSAPDVGVWRGAVWVNGGFETGTAGQAPPSPWGVTPLFNPGITLQNPQTFAGLNLQTSITGKPAPRPLTFIQASAGGPMSQPDALMGAGATLRWPRYGNQCALVNSNGTQQNANELSQTMTTVGGPGVDGGDVDPSDGLVHVRFVVAPVLENPNHMSNQQPYFFVQLSNLTQNTVLYSNFNFSNQSGVPWQTITTPAGRTFVYTNWQLIDIAPGAPALNPGDQVQLVLVGSGCSLGGHEGQIYVDGLGEGIAGLFISGKGPAQANPGTDITYTLMYRNGSASAEAGVVATFNTPPNTTFVSVTPPPGVTCSSPSAGMTGTVSCTLGNLAAGESGSFQVKVNINPGTTGTIIAGNYEIHSSAESSLLGPVITTLCGCTADPQCSSGQWCNESGNACTPTLANGTAMPTDGKHTNPTLNGKCSAQAGALVCTSAVCETSDNACGLVNGDGPCTAGNGGVVCRSRACDTNDGKCGFLVGDGPCTAADATIVCRSGTCSVSGTCMPPGGCNVDGDCSGGKWCNESVHTCTAKLANGTAIPTDAPHLSPTLNGVCTVAAGALVCISGVCDTSDNKCGFAVGDGPCSSGNAGVVCRSGACSTSGTCEPVGGCNVDGDCSGGKWCNEIMHACTAKLPNGSAVPNDPPHTNPTLSGTCTAAAGTLVCASGVCDVSDNECGFAVGDGPCTSGNAKTVCRSGACSTSGTCEPMGGCNVDADCVAPSWCDESQHLCHPQLSNGTPIPNDPPHTNPTLNGTCSAPAGALVCASGVCDGNDSRCGYANGDGQCNSGNAGIVCRSLTCSVAGTCVAMGGCNVDGDCAAGMWCNESVHMCQARLANGMPMPNDPLHTSPTLNGTCSAGAGTLVCVSGVCDVNDNRCGYAVGDGPCTSDNAGSVCRSGTCSTGGACEPTGGCDVDADCAAGSWCNETLHSCQAQLANGAALPSDSAHTSPTLDGTCSAAAAMLVCVSGVCDPSDSKCGFADGDGSCSSSNAGSVCRSGTCSTGGACEPMGGCDVDADCGGGNWCNVSMHACTAQLGNGSPLPSDPSHMGPTLDGTCSAAAGMLVCASGVCDSKDNRCGYANGDGQCNSGNGSMVCRSMACSMNGVCEPAMGCNVDGDCRNPHSPVCDQGSHTCSARAGGGNGGGSGTFFGGGFCSVAARGASGGETLPAAMVLVLVLLAARGRRRRGARA